MLFGAFLDREPPDVFFTDEAVVQCDFTAFKMILQVMVIYKCPQKSYDVNT